MKIITITLQVETEADNDTLKSTVKRWLNYGLSPKQIKKLNVFIAGKDEREN